MNVVLVFLGLALVSAAGDAPPTAKELLRGAENAQLAGKFQEAVDFFSKLIHLEPTAGNYFKRASVSMRRRNFASALSDMKTALAADASFAAKVLPHIGRAKMALGDCAGAVADYQELMRVAPQDKKAQKELPHAQACVQHSNNAKHMMTARAWGAAKGELTKALEFAPYSPSLLLSRCHCNLELREFQDVLVDTRNILQDNKGNVDALEARGKAFYGLTEFDNALNHYKEGLRHDPDHKTLKPLYRTLQTLSRKIKQAQETFDQHRFAEAASVWREAIALDPHSGYCAELFAKVCSAHSALSQHQEALAACSEAIARNPGKSDYFVARGNSRIEAGQFQEALHDFSKALELDGNNRKAQEGKQRAELELKKASRKDYYKILGVAQNANEKEIKRAYRKMAMKFHPDMHQGDHAKEEAEKQFKDVAESYEILSDAEKRGKYDRGEDIQPQQQQHNPFQQQGFHFHPGGGFPGGGQQFHFQSG